MNTARHLAGLALLAAALAAPPAAWAAEASPFPKAVRAGPHRLGKGRSLGGPGRWRRRERRGEQREASEVSGRVHGQVSGCMALTLRAS